MENTTTMLPVEETEKSWKTMVPLLNGCAVAYDRATGESSVARVEVTEMTPSKRDNGDTCTIGRIPHRAVTTHDAGACSNTSCGTTLLKSKDMVAFPEE
jgi:hypothetical protein